MRDRSKILVFCLECTCTIENFWVDLWFAYKLFSCTVRSLKNETNLFGRYGWTFEIVQIIVQITITDAEFEIF